MIYFGFLAFQSGLDLNFDPMTYGLLHVHAKDRHEPRQACFLPTHDIPATEHFSPLRDYTSRLSQGKRSINRALSAGGEFRDACVHVNKVDICDAEQLRGIERIGGGAQA